VRQNVANEHLASGVVDLYDQSVFVTADVKNRELTYQICSSVNISDGGASEPPAGSQLSRISSIGAGSRLRNSF
jgi:hypothetical protein